VSLHVLHNSPTSVLIAHTNEDAHGTAHILLGTDGSRGAEVARQVLIDFADPGRCDVRVVAVAQTTSAVAPDVPGVILPPSVAQDAEVTRRLVQQAERYTDEAAAALRSAGFRAETHLEEGHPAGGLLEDARRWNAELVVVGSRGLGATGRALLGSVSDRIVRQAPATLIARRSEHKTRGKEERKGGEDDDTARYLERDDGARTTLR
jgi:nucleotide-binding universal stress UspA family protein